MEKKPQQPQESRRKFLQQVSIAAMAALMPGVVRSSVTVDQPIVNAAPTVQEVIDTILKHIPGAPFAKTVDQLRSGKPQQPVTGIVTTMFPTLQVIEQAAKAGANMIIAHETPFYNNEDQTDWLADDEAYRYKINLLQKHQIAIWRFHDYWHAAQPDGIIMGNLLKLGWEKYYNAEQPRIVTLPNAMPLQAIVKHVKKKLSIPSVRVAGDLKYRCRTVYLAFGYMDSRRQIAAVQTHKPNVILSGETREWETVERVRDGLLMGNNTNLIVLSHSVSEEAGMEYAVQWLRPKFPGMLITHIPSGNPFQFK